MDFENLDEESVALLKDIIREKFEEFIRNPVLLNMLRNRPDLLKKYEPLFLDILLEKTSRVSRSFSDHYPEQKFQDTHPHRFPLSISGGRRSRILEGFAIGTQKYANVLYLRRLGAFFPTFQAY